MTALDAFPPMPCPRGHGVDRWSCRLCGEWMIRWDRAEAHANSAAFFAGVEARWLARRNPSYLPVFT